MKFLIKMFKICIKRKINKKNVPPQFEILGYTPLNQTIMTGCVKNSIINRAGSDVSFPGSGMGLFVEFGFYFTYKKYFDLCCNTVRSEILRRFQTLGTDEWLSLFTVITVMHNEGYMFLAA